MSANKFPLDYKDWTLFLDRDGVINERIPGSYVKRVEEFSFLPGALEALVVLSKKFPRIVVVTNQQGIGKGIMTEADLASVHQHMLTAIQQAGGRIDAVYFCPKLAKENPHCRKPNPGMAEQAKADFPSINFQKSIMVGDSISDMIFGQRLGMKTVYLPTKEEEFEEGRELVVDLRVGGLLELSKGTFGFPKPGSKE